MEKVTVYKLDETGKEVWQYPATVLERSATHVRLEAFFDREDLDLGYVVFAEGDRFVEYFYTDRWYNIFAVYDGADGRLKGWYCNVCRPASLNGGGVHCEDLALDLWVGTTGEPAVLDEDEFAALELTEDEKRKAESALGTLLELARNGQLPS